MAKKNPIGLDLGLLVLRLALGGIFILHGVGKFQGGGIDGFVGFVESLELPPLPPVVYAWAAVAAEIVGGLFVIFGFFPRLAALSLALVMVVAAVKVHHQHGFGLVIKAPLETIEKEWPKEGENGELRVVPNGIEYNVVLFAMSVTVVCAGAGGITFIGRQSPQKKKDS